ncbi:MAG TPA: F0F1 ATP synthase subunit delta [Terriglobales bacterium]|nr:F0F1 ATP synthase subunit delta [Terriglobales bacterium]
MIRTSKQARRDAKQLFRLCLVDGRLDENRVRMAVQGVLQSRRRGYLTLLSYFQRLVKLDRARHTANVESAVPLPADLQASVRSGLEEMYGTGITTLFAHNPGLIGGMRVQVGSDVYDGSVQSELAALEKRLGITTDGRNHEI